MASSSSNPRLLLLLSILLSVLSISASARPCKTFFISSYSFSVRPLYSSSSSSGFVTIVTEITQQASSSSSSSDMFLDPQVFQTDNGDQQQIRWRQEQQEQIRRQQQQQQQQEQGGALLPFGLSSYDITSLRDRTKDILSVVVALLFGVGCGALTAATMYLVWSIFSSSRYDYHHTSYLDEFDEEEDEDEGVSPKKMGYVKIAGADNALPAPVKEAV